MNASKEQAEQAKTDFLRIIESSPSLHKNFDKEIQRVSEFLDAAKRKLPTEDSFKKERNRRINKTVRDL